MAPWDIIVAGVGPENISAFGGDPENVTIFGESAGGWNVMSMVVSSGARPLSQSYCSKWRVETVRHGSVSAHKSDVACFEAEGKRRVVASVARACG